MKAILFFTFFFGCIAAVFSQSSYTLRIIDTQGKAMYGVEITARNASLVLKAKTDETGSAVFTLNNPGVYTFSYLEMKDVATYEVKEGIKGTFKRTTTYDPKGVFAVQPKIDRRGITFRTVPAQQLRGQANAIKMTIEVKEKSTAKVPGLTVELVSCADKTKYKGVTDVSGQAVFYIPFNKEYEIDLAGIEAIQKFNAPAFANAEAKEVVYYEQTKVKESAKGDTLIQEQVTQANGTTTHLLFTFHLKDYDGNPLPGEAVYVDAENKKRVYEGRTDAGGVCKFMLEKGSDYLVNLKYERGVHLVDAMTVQGFSSAMITRRYRGSAAVEAMLDARKMNAKGFVTNHSETPVRPAQKPVDFLKKTPTGFDIDFGTSGPIGTPTIAENKLFTQEGFYSPGFHCVQASTGQYLWGVELGESGMSPAVYQQGVLLINTYSCTLYALEASTGKMLWSKWLAGTIYSTPSAEGNSVYVVYNNGGSNPANPGENYVLASFDLRTGKTNWMNWVDTEVIACPVVEGSEVHVASQSGNYAVFDKVSGKLLKSSASVKAVSSPALTPGNIFITVSINGKEQLVVLDRNTLQVTKKYPTQLFPAKITESHDSYSQMNFNGAHPVVYKNKVILLEREKILAFDAETETLLWQKPVKLHPNQLPVVANGKVIIGTLSGEVISFDILTGASQTIRQHAGEIDGQPVSHGGLMYIASAGVLSVFKAIQNLSWDQWNKDARHNTYWE